MPRVAYKTSQLKGKSYRQLFQRVAELMHQQWANGLRCPEVAWEPKATDTNPFQAQSFVPNTSIRTYKSCTFIEFACLALYLYPVPSAAPWNVWFFSEAPTDWRASFAKFLARERRTEPAPNARSLPPLGESKGPVCRGTFRLASY